MSLKFWKFNILLRVGALTFNVNEKDPTQLTDRDRTLLNNHFIGLQECNIFAIILQEVDRSSYKLSTNAFKLEKTKKIGVYSICEGKFLKWLEYFNVIFNTLDIWFVDIFY